MPHFVYTLIQIDLYPVLFVTRHLNHLPTYPNMCTLVLQFVTTKIVGKDGLD